MSMQELSELPLEPLVAAVEREERMAREDADESRDPRDAVDLCRLFHHWLGNRVAREDPSHLCTSERCELFRKGTFYVCAKTGRVHQCDDDNCDRRIAPSRSGHLVCPVTGLVYQMEPQLDYHQEQVFLNGQDDEEGGDGSKVERGVRKLKRERGEETALAARRQQIELAVEEVCLPGKSEIWRPHRAAVVSRVEHLLPLIGLASKPVRYSAIAILYLLASGSKHLGKEILAKDQLLAQSLVPMQTLVNRAGGGYGWLAQVSSNVRTRVSAYTQTPAALAKPAPLGTPL